MHISKRAGEMTPQATTLVRFNMHMMHISKKSKLERELTFEMVMQDATAAGGNDPPSSSSSRGPCATRRRTAALRVPASAPLSRGSLFFTIPLHRSFRNHYVRLERAGPESTPKHSCVSRQTEHDRHDKSG